MTPITQLEKFLNGIVDGGSVPEPRTRIETMLNDIKNGDVVSLTPLTREETFLAKISGADVVISDPITRIETFLAKIAGAEVETPMPITRIEWWLNEWAGGGSDPLNTFTGAIVRFLAKKAKPIVKIEANFTPIQDLNGYDAPWPPGGGKNKFSLGTINVSAVQDFNIDPVPAGTYVFSTVVTCTNTTENVVVIFKDANGSSLASKSIVPNTGTRQFTASITVNAPIAKITLYSGNGWGGAQGNTSIWSDNMLADASVVSYVPYSNICPISGHTGCDIFDKAEYDAQATPTVSISFGQTVYSGTLTVNEDGTGTVTATHGIITANGTESWTKPDNCFKTESLHADSDYPQGISNTYKVGTSYSAVNGNNNRIAAHSTWVRIHDERFSTTDALKTYLSENNVQFVYELATPITIPVTAQQIQTLVGENNVWVNDATGDITVQAYGTEIT